MNVAIVTARWKSERLPGKALADICGKPLLRHVVDRARMARTIDKVVVATTLTSSPIIDYCQDNMIDCYIGNEEDILSRLYGAAERFGADVVVRVWGDCPMVDPELIDDVVELLIQNNYNYTHNTGYARGQEVSAIPFHILSDLCQDLNDWEFRHWFHVYCVKNLNVGEVKNPIDAAKVNYAVDTQEDLERIREIVRSRVG